MKYSRNKLEEYSEKISETEKIQCENAIDMVKDALKDYGYRISQSKLNFSDDGYAYYYKMNDNSFGNLTVIVQGSYANNTNIRRYSDVDISVVYSSLFSTSLENQFYEFKSKVFNALRDKFGSDVIRKNKSIRVKGNTNRKSIDVVAAFAIGNKIENGIQFLTDDGIKIVNYPLKQIKNENEKHRDTNYYFKKYVRILKNIKEDMLEHGYLSASKIGSFQVESLLWNLNNSLFNTYSSIGYGINNLISTLKSCKCLLYSYKESNGIKPLCKNEEVESNLKMFISDITDFFEFEG